MKESLSSDSITHRHFTDERIEAIRNGSPLTVAEREFLVTDTPTFEEYQPFAQTNLRALTDMELMSVAYDVWAEYASTQRLNMVNTVELTVTRGVSNARAD